MSKLSKAFLALSLLMSSFSFGAQWVPYYQGLTLPVMNEGQNKMEELWGFWQSYTNNFDDLNEGLGYCICGAYALGDYDSEAVCEGCPRADYCVARDAMKKALSDLIKTDQALLKKLAPEGDLNKLYDEILKSLEIIAKNDQYLLATCGPLHHDQF
jgi:hypothetical protein